MLPLLGGGLVTIGFSSVVLSLALWARAKRGNLPHEWAWAAAALATGATATLLAGEPLWVAACAVTGLLAIAKAFRHFHLPGALAMAAAVAFWATSVAWSVMVVVLWDQPAAARILIGLCALTGLVTLANDIMDAFLYREILCRDNWRRPRVLSPAFRRLSGPLVSVHVPCYAEPPDLVCETLDALAHQDYRDFEVLVIDNNTDDECLWRPVEAKCRTLGERFRFFHVDRLAGAKAGALNFALRNSNAGARLIAVVDADYLAQPNFLSSMVGYFEDPAIGFTQARHDYRDWHHNGYLRACYGEYRITFGSFMVSMNDSHSGITVGTMCLLRREALTRAGGWSQWCVTEDSELATRIYLAGYEGLYFDQPLGFGLIPETFAAYRRQRHRWSRGPVQELMLHWRAYLPTWHRGAEGLSAKQKVLLGLRGLSGVAKGVKFMLTLAIAALVLALALTGSPAPVGMPLPVLLALIAGTLAGDSLTLLAHVHSRQCSLREAVDARLAGASLTYVKRMAALGALLGRVQPWGRTPKFREFSTGWRVLAGTQKEILVGIYLFLVCAVALLAWRLNPTLLWILLTIAANGLACLAAPWHAWRAELALRKQIATAATVPDRAGTRDDSLAVVCGGKSLADRG